MNSILEEVEIRARTWPSSLLFVDRKIDVSRSEFSEYCSYLKSIFSSLGVSKGDRIGVVLPQSSEFVACMLSCWSLGASYVPIDSEEPNDRIESKVESVGIRFIVSLSETLSLLGLRHDTIDSLVFGNSLGVARVRSELLYKKISRWEDEAYAMFTSGTSGYPKAVSISHSSLLEYLAAIRQYYRIPETGFHVAMQLPVTFDAALTSILIPIVSNNIGHIFETNDSKTASLADFMENQGSPLLVKTTPSQLRLLNDIWQTRTSPSISGIVIVGGEQLDFIDLKYFRDNKNISVINEYGPTEATVGCLFYEIKSADPESGPVPIGKPFDNITLLVSKEKNTQIVGELQIGGSCVANGYVNGPSEPKFYSIDGVRFYASGDLVTVAEDRQYYYRGRIDDQVKINGHRIEMLEIEAVMRKLSFGDSVAVCIVDGQLFGAVDKKRMRHSKELDTFYSQLRRSLPGYMLPAAIVVTRIPITNSGKVDRGALRELVRLELKEQSNALSFGSSLKGRIDIEQLWLRLLDISEISSETDFFSSGGDSILALQLVGTLSELIGDEIPVSLLFDFPKYLDFCSELDDRKLFNLRLDQTEDATDESYNGHIRIVSPLQKSIFAAEVLSKDTAYNVSSAVEVYIEYEWSMLSKAILMSIGSHECLAWKFKLDAELGISATVPNTIMPINVISIDMRDLDTNSRQYDVSNRLKNERLKSYALLDGQQGVGALVLRTSEKCGVCVINAHHVLVDELSIELIWKEVAKLVSEPSANIEIDRNYDVWSRQVNRPERIERSKRVARELAERIRMDKFCLPYPKERINANAFKPDNIKFSVNVSARLGKEICCIAGEISTTPNVLYGAFAARAIALALAVERFVVHMPMTLRRKKIDYSSVGCYVNRVPILVNYEQIEPSFEMIIRAWANELSYSSDRSDLDLSEFDKLLNESSVDWPGSSKVDFVFEKSMKIEETGIELQFLPQMYSPMKSEYEFHFNANEAGEESIATFGCCSSVSNRLTLQKMASGFMSLVEKCVTDYGDNSLAAEYFTSQRLSSMGKEAENVPSYLGEDDELLNGGHLSQGMNKVLPKVIATLENILGSSLEQRSNIFENGARSIDLFRIAATLNIAFDVNLKPVDVFDFPTPHDLSELVLAKQMIGN